MEHAEAAAECRPAGGNSWAIYDDTLPEKGRGNVRWRTLIEQMLNRGGPRLCKNQRSREKVACIIGN